MSIMKYIQNPSLIESKMSSEDPRWDDHRKRYIEHIQNQYINLKNLCNKYPFRYEESLEVLALIVKVLKENPELTGIFHQAHTDSKKWKERWEENE